MSMENRTPLGFGSAETAPKEIPPLDAQTANQLLNNVFTSCDMKPSVIPVEVLESWGNYKKPVFNFGRFIAYIGVVLLVLLPLMFLHPTVIAERTNVKSAANAIYKIRVQTLLPIESVSAELDGHPVLITKSGPKQYSAEITDNGTMTITVHSFNGQTASKTYKVCHLDTEKPEFIRSYSENGIVYLEVRDTYSGIDYDNISGLTPVSYDEEKGLIAFTIPEAPTQITIPDRAGNELLLLLSPVTN